jgi:hypothetical protein
MLNFLHRKLTVETKADTLLCILNLDSTLHTERVFVKLNATRHAVAIQKACVRNFAVASAFSMTFTACLCCKLKAEKRWSASNSREEFSHKTLTFSFKILHRMERSTNHNQPKSLNYS